MAVQLSVNQSTYSRYEDNQHDITIKQLHNIASVLDISIYVLIDFDEKYIFNNYGTANDMSFSVNHISSNKRELYNKTIKSLEEQIKLLKKLNS